MPRKPNYNFEKRQKEAAKQQRKAEKRERKRGKKEGEPEDGVNTDSASTPPENPPE